MQNTKKLIVMGLMLAGAAPGAPAQNNLDQNIQINMASWIETYKHFHENPELSTQEKQTSAIVAANLRNLGYEVTEHFGQYSSPDALPYGVVGVLRNGPGPTVYVRTDMDALPVTENTGLPYASRVRVKGTDSEVGVMHACGHDLHMTVFLATAKMLSEDKTHWSGTVVMIGQPAEELGQGAASLLNAGLFTKFPKPDYVLALHDSPAVPAGKVAWITGAILAGSDSVDITFRGYGGHGATPQLTKDPIVIASEFVLAVQTIVSREMSPLEPTVVTVGSFHAGTKHNIIPDEAHLQLTVRTMNPAQRTKVLSAISRMAKGISAAAGVPEERAPTIEIKNNSVATVNDAGLTQRITLSLQQALGKDNVMTGQPVMASEDFSLYALADPKPPTTMFWLGASDPAKWKDFTENGARMPGLHSSEFAPVPEPAIRTGVKAMTSAVEDLLKN